MIILKIQKSLNIEICSFLLINNLFIHDLEPLDFHTKET